MRSRLAKLPRWTRGGLRGRLPAVPRWALLAVALVLAVCGGAATALLASGGGDDGPVPSAAGVTGESVASAEARVARAASERRAVVTRQLERMSLPDRVAQLFLFGFSGTGAGAPVVEILRDRALGGLVVTAENYVGPGQLEGLTAAARRAASDEDHVRPLVMAPQEGGPANALPGLPPGTAPAALEDPVQGGAEAARAAPRLLELGIDGVLAPIADVAAPEAPALGPRAYSDDPEQTAEFVRRVVRAYRSAGVVAAPAHFPGLGAAAQPTEAGPAQVVRSEEELAEADLAPFRAAMRAGVPAMVLSHGLYAADDFVTPGSLSRRIVTGLLRERLGFGGVAITDDLTSPAVVSLYEVPDAAVTALRAGADMLQVSGSPETQADVYDAVLSRVVAGRIDRARIDESVRRILTLKQSYGLLVPAAGDARVWSSP